jgi:hypothetical protein
MIENLSLFIQAPLDDPCQTTVSHMEITGMKPMQRQSTWKVHSLPPKIHTHRFGFVSPTWKCNYIIDINHCATKRTHETTLLQTIKSHDCGPPSSETFSQTQDFYNYNHPQIHRRWYKQSLKGCLWRWVYRINYSIHISIITFQKTSKNICLYLPHLLTHSSG